MPGDCALSQEDSSFCEQKEAKKLHSLAPRFSVANQRSGQGIAIS
jgi:hypothetical protein